MKVVLSGLGGDEWFAGYSSFERVPWFRRAHHLLGPLRSVVAWMLAECPPGSPWRRFSEFLRNESSWLNAYQVQRGIFTEEEAVLLANAFTGDRPFDKSHGEARWPDDPRDVVSLLELTRYMRNQLLRDSDVFSMAHGLELRVPFVDVRLAESLSAIPARVRLRQGKQLLLEAMPEVPEWVRNQPKRGFRFPFQQWMEGQFGELLAEAKKASPVRLETWYRTWALAAAMRRLESEV
jgi:asparagine synthase (glutamine-hydrolysing)